METIRKIEDGRIAIDTAIVETKVYDIVFLQDQKVRLETELAEVNSILAKIESVKESEVIKEKTSLLECLANIEITPLEEKVLKN